jgi:hypothetical protein
MKNEDKPPKWCVFLDPKGDVSGVEDENGQLIAKFNPYDPPLFRAALARNIFWVQGCIRADIKYNKYSFRSRWKKMFARLRVKHD